MHELVKSFMFSSCDIFISFCFIGPSSASDFFVVRTFDRDRVSFVQGSRAQHVGWRTRGAAFGCRRRSRDTRRQHRVARRSGHFRRVVGTFRQRRA